MSRKDRLGPPGRVATADIKPFILRVSLVLFPIIWPEVNDNPMIYKFPSLAPLDMKKYSSNRLFLIVILVSNRTLLLPNLALLP